MVLLLLTVLSKFLIRLLLIKNNITFNFARLTGPRNNYIFPFDKHIDPSSIRKCLFDIPTHPSNSLLMPFKKLFVLKCILYTFDKYTVLFTGLLIIL